MPREIPDSYRADLEATGAMDVLLPFLTIEHESLSDPIRVVADTRDYIWNGQAFTGIMFDLTIVSDTDQPPTARLRVQNVDRRIGQALRDARNRAQVSLSLLSSADFDLTVSPATEIGNATVLYAATRFELVDVDADVLQIQGRIRITDTSVEPWPRARATEDRLPGLFR